MLRTYNFDIIDNMYYSKSKRKIYKFHQTVLYMVDQEKDLLCLNLNDYTVKGLVEV